MNVDKHFTATTYIFDPKQPQTLLHFHPKLNSWLPAGGHLEANEAPHEAALREIYEEIGDCTINLISGNSSELLQIDDRGKFLPMPHYLLSEKIEEYHYHLDWIFYAWLIGDVDLNFKNGFRWFSKSEIVTLENCFENVKQLALIGFDKFY
ncbi:MAG: NUDIX domain-containing protein [Candidatus Heimdallarchaeota archaeon]|nr:NUDIX domain-containing protein [Candidatus Heimdallarchaeota archaeon]